MKSRYVIFSGIGVFVFLALIMPSVFYLMFETREFPNVEISLPSKYKELQQKDYSTLTENEKGIILSQSVVNQLNRELNSPMGWSVNDLFLSPTSYFDNRQNRQRGVIFATRMITPIFSNNMAKFGYNDNEDNSLKEARTQNFAINEESWGFLWVYSEKYYKNGIKNFNTYQDNVINGKSIYNTKTDDIYTLLTFITDKDIMHNVIGRLSRPAEKVGFLHADDDIYYAQGVMLVVRDVVIALVQLYPEILNKGGRENIQEAIYYMDKICTFNPPIVCNGDNESIFADHRALIFKYYKMVEARLDDVANSILK